MDLIDIVPLRARGPKGPTIIIARENYDAWLQREGPGLLADGFIRLIVKDHTGYEARQFTKEG